MFNTWRTESAQIAGQSSDPNQGRDPKVYKNWWGAVGKVSVTVTAFAFLATQVDVSSSLLAIRRSLGIWLVLATLTNVLALAISAFKWDLLLRALGISVSKRQVMRLYTIGVFVSSFLPGIVGGDVVRGYLAGTRAGGYVKVAATIVVERVTGVVALLVMAVIALAWFSAHLATVPLLALVFTIGVGLVSGIALVLNRQVATRLAYRARNLRIRPIVRTLYRLHQVLRGFRVPPLLVAVGYSFIFYIVCGLTFYLICLAFGADITFGEAVSVQVVICLLTLLPISVGGLGVVQAGDVYLLGLMNIDPSQALGISLIRLLVHYSVAMVGGVLFMQWKGESGVRGTAELKAGAVGNR